jgi:hypothetical protein
MLLPVFKEGLSALCERNKSHVLSQRHTMAAAYSSSGKRIIKNLVLGLSSAIIIQLSGSAGGFFK